MRLSLLTKNIRQRQQYKYNATQNSSFIIKWEPYCMSHISILHSPKHTPPFIPLSIISLPTTKPLRERNILDIVMGKGKSCPEIVFGVLTWVVIMIMIYSQYGDCKVGHNSNRISCKPVEREALLSIKQYIDTPPDRVSTWMGEECCHWEGVTCDSVTGNIIELNLAFQEKDDAAFCALDPNRVCGYMPFIPSFDAMEPLSKLEHLTHLDLSRNSFKPGVQIPGFIGSMRQLKYLAISQTGISGLLPPAIGNLTNLQVLDLSRNSLEGPFLHNLSSLASLRLLDLSHNSFNGSIPLWVSNIKGLRFLDLSGNQFNRVEGGIWSILGNPCMFKHFDLSSNILQGEIQEPPATFSRCTRYDLEFLDLSGNNISGNLPSFLGQFKSLKYLALSSNKFQGQIPTSLGLLTHLDFLDISSNSLQSALPPLSNLSMLSFVDMSHNSLNLKLGLGFLFPGHLIETFRMRSCNVNTALPKLLQNPGKIQELDLSDNNITGELPKWLSNMSDKATLNLSNNLISGSIKNLNFNLETLDLSNNNLDGQIPTWLGNFTWLTVLDLSENRLSGNIPPWSQQDLENLQILRVQRNHLGEGSGIIADDEMDATMLESLCNLQSLEVLDLQRNKLTGTIPNCWGNMMSLLVINLSSNMLSGVIPCSLGLIGGKLQYLHLNDNKLHGHVPSCLKNLAKLTILNLGENDLSGMIPTWMNRTTFSGLEILRLPGNKLHGTIPKQLCSLPHLHLLDLANNQLIGNIPPCLGNLAGMNSARNTTSEESSSIDSSDGDDTIVHENNVTEIVAGVERQYASTLRYVFFIDLSSNDLVGSIPHELTNLSGLLFFNLSNNHLSGNIPDNIGHMRALISLDLSRNNLSGEIPTSLANLYSLSKLNLSYNNLSGPIPTGDQLQTLSDPSIYVGNPYLCGDPLPKKCTSHAKQPSRSVEDQDKDKGEKHERIWLYLAVMLGFATGFWGIVGTLVLKKSLRHALFRLVEDGYDWSYVSIVVNIKKLKKMIKKD